MVHNVSKLPNTSDRHAYTTDRDRRTIGLNTVDRLHENDGFQKTRGLGDERLLVGVQRSNRQLDDGTHFDCPEKRLLVEANAVAQELEEDGKIGRVRAEERRQQILFRVGLGETFLYVA